MALAPALALALMAALGPSEGEPARISWEAPLACPDAQWLERRVGAYLGRELEGEREVALVGRVQEGDGGYVLELATEVAGVRDRQRLEHHDCKALVEIAASLAAIAIDPLALTRPEVEPAADPRDESVRVAVRRAGVRIQRPSSRGGAAGAIASPATPASRSAATAPPASPSSAAPSTTSSATSPPLPPGAPTATPAASPPPSAAELAFGPLVPDLDAPDPNDDTPRRDTGPRQTRLLLGANAGLALNLFPNPAPQIHAGIGLSRGGPRVAFRAELAGGAALAGRFRSADGTVGGDLLAWEVALRPCAVPRWGIVELRTCAAFGGGQIRARGVGVADVLRRAHPWLWLAAEAGVGVEVQRNVALVLDLGAGFNVYRPNFSVSSPDASYTTPVVSGHGRLGVELRFF